ncbi:MAG: hypothetical protein ACI8XO_000859 [Verrucomicrobiales bacterium]
MFYRLSCAAVIVFWIVMTIQLVLRSYFSTEDRLPLVKDPSEIVNRFVSHPKTSNLNVYRDRKLVGSISISPSQLKNGNSELLLSAIGKINFPGLEEQDIGWRGTLELTPGHEVVGFELKVKFRYPRIDVGLIFDLETLEIGYQVEQDGEIIIDSGDSDSKAVKRVKFMLAAWGLSPKALKRKEARGAQLQDDDVMIARYGRVVIGGERQTAYVLELAPMRGKRFKIYFSEAAELLKIGNVLGYEVLSEGFKLMPDETTEGETQ